MNDFSRTVFFVSGLMALAAATVAQQVSDPDFKPEIREPAFEKGRGPKVFIDEAHNNFHTAGGRYATFADLLRRDGFVVAPLRKPFAADSLQDVDILVVSNALGPDDERNESLPTPPAFSDDEIEAVAVWVREGGALLLIADHMPFGGAAAALARPFGARFTNGYTMGSPDMRRSADHFTRENGLLRDHPIVRGRNEHERVTSVATFMGQGFQVDGEFEPILVFGPEAFTYMTSRWGQFDEATPTVHSGGWLHAGARRFGEGRVVLFGEAAMFSAQVSGPGRLPMGMNHPEASQNPQFVLNVAHWLAGLLDE